MANRHIKVITTLYRNGVPVGPVDISRVNGEGVKRAVVLALVDELAGMFQLFVGDMQDSLRDHSRHARSLQGKYAQEKTLLEAYSMAIGGSVAQREPAGASLRLFKSSEVDRAMKLSRVGSREHALWWRAHEYGNPSGRVLGSSEYSFVPKEGAGRHGEGFMVKREGKRQPHRGSVPFRLIPTMKMRMREQMNSRDFHDRVMGRALASLRG